MAAWGGSTAGAIGGATGFCSSGELVGGVPSGGGSVDGDGVGASAGSAGL
jgi:hypothetical protein